jgi:hypothetical protein
MSTSIDILSLFTRVSGRLPNGGGQPFIGSPPLVCLLQVAQTSGPSLANMSTDTYVRCVVSSRLRPLVERPDRSGIVLSDSAASVVSVDGHAT